MEYRAILENLRSIEGDMEFDGSANCTSDYLTALGYAIETFNKAIPKSVVKQTKHFSWPYPFISGECPNCGYHVGNFKNFNYCNNCGQRLKFDDADAVCLCDEKEQTDD